MLASVIHHIATLFGFKNGWDMPHYPWFMCFPLGFHCVLIAFPYDKWLHAPYGLAMFCFVFGVFFEPFRNTKSFY
jgi:hypothetical protein